MCYCHLFLISSAIRSISVLYYAHLCMKYPLGICNFLEHISSLSNFVVFLYFFALSTEEGFLISLEIIGDNRLAILWNSIQMGNLSFSSLPSLLFFSQLVGLPKTTIFLFTFLFLGDDFDHYLYIVSQTSVHSSSGLYQIQSLEPVCHFHCRRDLIYVISD